MSEEEKKPRQLLKEIIERLARIEKKIDDLEW